MSTPELRAVPADRPWGQSVGYSRAVRVGSLIEVSGTSAADRAGAVRAPGDAYGQTREVLTDIIAAIEELGGRASDIVRTRIFVTSIDYWGEVGRAHGEVFHEILPTSTIVQVGALMLPDLLVEVEATAVVRSSD